MLAVLHGCGYVCQVLAPAVLDQQMSANEIRQTCAVLDVLVPDDVAIRGKLGACEEIADLLKRSTVLQGETHQASHHVVEPDQFRGTVRAFHAQEDFGGVCVVMDAEVERALIGNSDFLCDVVAASRKGTTQTLAVAYIVHAICKSL